MSCQFQRRLYQGFVASTAAYDYIIFLNLQVDAYPDLYLVLTVFLFCSRGDLLYGRSPKPGVPQCPEQDRTSRSLLWTVHCDLRAVICGPWTGLRVLFFVNCEFVECDLWNASEF